MSKQTTERLVLTIPEAADLLGLSVRSTYDSCNFTLDSRGISGKALSAYADGINKTHYEETDAFARCPGFLVNHMSGASKCPNMAANYRCALLDHQRVKFFGKLGKGTVELAFDVRIDLPSKYYEEVILDFPLCDKLTLLKLYDRVCAAKINYDRHAGSPDEEDAHDALKSAQYDFDKVLEYFHKMCEDNIYTFKKTCHIDYESQLDLAHYYEKDQFIERSLQGEPVLYHQGRLYFENIIFEHGYRPGIFPGLDLYTKDGKPVDPEEFSQWLKQMLPERSKNFHRRASFWGCPACVVNPGDLVRYVGIQSNGRVVLGNSYRLSPISSNVFRSPGFDKDFVTYFPDQRVNYL